MRPDRRLTDQEYALRLERETREIAFLTSRSVQGQMILEWANMMKTPPGFRTPEWYKRVELLRSLTYEHRFSTGRLHC
jgi:hypothetical protein